MAFLERSRRITRRREFQIFTSPCARACGLNELAKEVIRAARVSSYASALRVATARRLETRRKRTEARFIGATPQFSQA